MAGQGQQPQYASQQIALQGALPSSFYNLQPAMTSYEDLQLLQQRLPYMQQGQITLTRDGMVSPSALYAVSDVAKYRTDQSYAAMPSSLNQQYVAAAAAAAANGSYITAAGNAPLLPYNMYPNMTAAPGSYPQYGVTPTLIQIPANSLNLTAQSQYPLQPKLVYGGGSTFYDSLPPEYKAAYATSPHAQNKVVGSGSAANSGSDLTGYKSHHLGKANRTYDRQGYPPGTPPPFNLGTSVANPVPHHSAYNPMFIPTMPAAAPATQHHNPLIHHQINQDGEESGGQRSVNGVPKGASKGSYTSGSYWGAN